MDNDKKSSTETKLTSFPCPKCGKEYVPQITLKSKAMMICPEHGLFERDIKRSLSFRKFCSKLGSKPNRSPFYYTSPERRIKKLLDELKIVYFHNVGIEVNGRKYWLDFYIPPYTILSINPGIWHKLWNREESDRIKYLTLKEKGFPVVIADDKILKMKDEELKEWLKETLTVLSSNVDVS